MLWARLLAYVTGTVNQQLLLQNEYLAAENRILKARSHRDVLVGMDFFTANATLLE